MLGYCEDSSVCGDGGFCNFKSGDSWGLCKYCSELGRDTCEDYEFSTQKGEEECKAKCEG